MIPQLRSGIDVRSCPSFACSSDECRAKEHGFEIAHGAAQRLVHVHTLIADYPRSPCANSSRDKHVRVIAHCEPTSLQAAVGVTRRGVRFRPREEMSMRVATRAHATIFLIEIQSESVCTREAICHVIPSKCHHTTVFRCAV